MEINDLSCNSLVVRKVVIPGVLLFSALANEAKFIANQFVYLP